MKKKIAILGAGMSGLTAAYELTSDPSWATRYEVTIYQLGWRVGGKTATGRGRYQRIEEHGIHILQGWYENTFRLLQEVYAERKARGLDPKSPFQHWRDGLVNDSATLLTEWIPGRGWVNWPMIFPTNDAIPGQGPPLSFAELLKKGIAIVLETLLGSPYQTGESPIVTWILDHFFPTGTESEPPPLTARPPWWDLAVDQARKRYPATGDPRMPDELKLAYYARSLVDSLDAAPGATEVGGAHPRDVVLGIWRDLIDWLEQLLKDVIDIEDRIRRVLILLDLGVVIADGILCDVLVPGTWPIQLDFTRINDRDFRAWIAEHGARPRTAQSVVVRFLYTGTFANLTDGTDAGGQLAAGSALHFLLASLGYKGSFVWKFKAGTGDTMVMPIYQVLRARGVQIELFREVVRVVPSSTGEIEQIDIGEQVTLVVPEYRPTFVATGEVTAWPSEPLYDQIDPREAALLRERHVDLEQPWSNWTNPRTRTLRRGTDFDAVVLAIPVAALEHCCSEIVATTPAWKAMVAAVATTQTQSMQLWLARSLAELGMDLGDWGMAPDDAPNTVVYANPIYSWIDMSLVLPYERWPAAYQPKLCVYYTGPLADADPIPGYAAHWFPEQQHGRVVQIAGQWLQDQMGWFWPRGTAFEAPQGLDWSLLEDGEPGTSPGQKWRGQYFRANVAPWQRFTLAIPRTERFRLKTDRSGFANLFLAGDWIDYGMNVGYIEGAIVSGIQAAGAVKAWLGLDAGRPPIAPPDLVR